MNAVKTTAFLETNARYAVLAWEPVARSGERLNVGAFIEFDNRIAEKQLIRGEALHCMYGAAGEGITAMIKNLLKAMVEVAKKHGWDAALDAIPLANFSFLPTRATYATSEEDLFRQIVLTHCSLSVLAEDTESSAEDSPTPEREVNQQWTTKIREAIQIARPELSLYFNREAVLVDGGVPVKFGLLSPKLAAHFGLLRGSNQGQGMKDARAKMWELSLAKERNDQLTAALICGIRALDDITLSDKQRSQLQANALELEQEAKYRRINLRNVYTESEAVEAVLALA